MISEAFFYDLTCSEQILCVKAKSPGLGFRYVLFEFVKKSVIIIKLSN